MKKQTKRLWAMFLALMMLFTCVPANVSEAKAAQKKVAVKSLSINKTQYVLAKGQKVNLKATILPKLAAKSNKIKWTTSNAKLVKVSSKGVAQAVGKKGKVVITARAGSKKATCKITIGAAVKKITASDISLTVGKSKTIKAKLTPSKPVIAKLTYKSSNTKVATVNSKGKVTAKKAGSAKITITATDRGQVKKIIKVTVKKAEPETPPEVPPTFGISVNETEKALSLGDVYKIDTTFTSNNGEEIDDKTLFYESSDKSIVAINSVNGDIKAVGTGEATVTVTSAKDSRVSATCTFKISEDGIINKEVASQSELDEALALNGKCILTLRTDATQINIPDGDYSDITLVVDAPNAHIENKGRFSSVLIKSIAKDTWVEKSGNDLYIYGSGHYKVDGEGKPNVFVQEASDAVTVTNDGDLQSIFIAQAAKVLVKGDSVANRIPLTNQYGKTIETYVPLDIYSVEKYQLTVGPGGEQTALKVNNSENIPDIKGIGTLTVTIDSTGEDQTVIADNDDTMELPATTIQGKVVNEDGTSAQDVKVYLVKYSKKVDGENISIYLSGTDTKTTKTDENGQYTFENAKVGNYIIVVEAAGYQLITVNTYVPVSYADTIYEQDDITLLKDAGQAGTINGVLTDAEDGNVISAGLTVILRKGMNNITKDTIAEVTSDENGGYIFEDVVPGQYTIQVVDRRDEGDYVSAYYNISLMSSETRTKNIVVSRNVGNTNTRFVLSWEGEKEGVSPDLDIHACGVNNANCEEFDVKFGNKYMSLYDIYYRDAGSVELDVDDKSYEGPETITIRNNSQGYYNIFVQDYTNLGYGDGLKNSKPVIKMYSGNHLIDTIKMPDKDGGNWFVGVYDAKNKKFSIANEVYDGTVNSTVRAQITKYLNYFEQFIVEDAQTFASYQSVIDVARENYTKETDAAVLQKYCDDLEKAYEEVTSQMIIGQICDSDNVISTYKSYENRHDSDIYLHNANSEPSLNIKSVEGLSATFTLKTEESYDKQVKYYDMKLANSKLGIYTHYEIRYYIVQAKWVKDIRDPGNADWSFSELSSYSNAYGRNANIGRGLEYEFYDDIKLISTEYREDVAEDKWTYGKVALVLHLENEKTGAKYDYPVYYYVLGADLMNVVDENNTYYKITNNRFNHYSESANVEIFGENETLGNTWKPVVDSNCTYEIVDIPEEENYRSADAAVKVTEDNGAVCTYYIKYTVDTSDAELLGITDNTNVFTYYNVTNNYYSDKNIYNIELNGAKSELGENLKAHVRKGATAEIEYATGSVSFDNTSDAKITVTGRSGRQRVYYVAYNKTRDDSQIKSISSETGKINKIYMSENSYIYMYGFDKNIPEDLKIEPVSGYTVTIDKDVKNYSDSIETKAVLTNNVTGEEKTYTIYYYYEEIPKDIVNIYSKKDNNLISSIYTYSDSINVDGKYITFYKCKVKGDSNEIPDDMSVTTPRGTTSTVEYAKDNKDWKYGENYQAAVTVKDENEDEKLYLISYEIDTSGTNITNVYEENNRLIDYDISTNSNIYYSDNTTAKGSLVEIIGTNLTCGANLQITIPKNSQIIKRVRKGEEGWNIDESSYASYKKSYYTNNKYYYGVHVEPVEYVEVKASNGVVMPYVIMYGADKSGCDINEITLKNDEIVYSRIDDDESWIYDDDNNSEKMGTITLVGNKDKLDLENEFKVADGTSVKVVSKYTDEDWKYAGKEWTIYYSVNDKSCNSEAKYYEIIEITASNGVVMKYAIIYAQDTSGVTIDSIVNDGDEFAYISSYLSNGYYYKKSDDSCDVFDCIDIVGKGTLDTFKPIFNVPEGSKANILAKSTDESWEYKFNKSNTISYSMETDEPGEYKSIVATVCANILIEVVSDKGVSKKYMINYAIEPTGLEVSAIDYEGKIYSEDSYKEWFYIDDVDTYCKTILTAGTAETLPESVKYSIPDSSRIEVVSKSTDSDWKYKTGYLRIMSGETEDGSDFNVNVRPAELVKITDKYNQTAYYMIYYGQYTESE